MTPEKTHSSVDIEADPVFGGTVQQAVQAYDLIKEKGQIGAILFCEEMMQDKRKQINQMTFYDGEKVLALQNSIMNWGAIRSRVEKGFA